MCHRGRPDSKTTVRCIMRPTGFSTEHLDLGSRKRRVSGDLNDASRSVDGQHPVSYLP